MNVRAYLSTLPEQSLAVRRRFVIIGTTLSFVALLLLWMGARALGRHGEPSASPRTPTATPVVPAPDPTGILEFPSVAPTVPSSGVSVEGLSANLLRALGTPRPTP